VAFGLFKDLGPIFVGVAVVVIVVIIFYQREVPEGPGSFTWRWGCNWAARQATWRIACAWVTWLTISISLLAGV